MYVLVVLLFAQTIFVFIWQLTHFVLAKELKHCRKIEDLVVNDSVKHKAKDFIKKYMTKFGPSYKRGNDDDS